MLTLFQSTLIYTEDFWTKKAKSELLTQYFIDNALKKY